MERTPNTFDAHRPDLVAEGRLQDAVMNSSRSLRTLRRRRPRRPGQIATEAGTEARSGRGILESERRAEPVRILATAAYATVFRRPEIFVNGQALFSGARTPRSWLPPSKAGAENSFQSYCDGRLRAPDDVARTTSLPSRLPADRSAACPPDRAAWHWLT